MRNGSIIKAHNNKIISKVSSEAKKCNCKIKKDCPLQGKCLSTQIVYKATVTTEDESKSYIGLAGGTFKERFNNHTKSFRHKKYGKETELAKCIWDLKRRQKEYSVTWEIVRQSNTVKRLSGQCNLCLDEKLEILKLKNAINRRSELISKCRHGIRPSNRVKKKK